MEGVTKIIALSNTNFHLLYLFARLLTTISWQLHLLNSDASPTRDLNVRNILYQSVSDHNYHVIVRLKQQVE